MNFIDWLPITARNRVALCLAAFSLVMFVVWNCLPYYEMNDPAPYWIITIVLMALSLFSISAAFFLFRNELALREARSHGMRVEGDHTI